MARFIKKPLNAEKEKKKKNHFMRACPGQTEKRNQCCTIVILFQSDVRQTHHHIEILVLPGNGSADSSIQKLNLKFLYKNINNYEMSLFDLLKLMPPEYRK